MEGGSRDHSYLITISVHTTNPSGTPSTSVVRLLENPGINVSFILVTPGFDPFRFLVQQFPNTMKTKGIRVYYISK